MPSAPTLDAFHWQPHPAAESALDDLVAAFLDRCPPAQALARRMQAETATRFPDWIDHLVVPRAALGRLRAAGFVDTVGSDALAHPGGRFPTVLAGADDAMTVALKVESVADVAAVHGVDAAIAGGPGARFRRLRVALVDGHELAVVERHGWDGCEPAPEDPARAVAGLAALESFRSRRRDFIDTADAFAHTAGLIDRAIAACGRDPACERFFAAEREFWQRRNRAGQVQKARQDALGLGWANHDHHTYRSSREAFPLLIAVLERLGFTCRERFYAGGGSGWGAQVLEQAVTGIVIFADVDLSPDELSGDFAHDGLPPQAQLGTIGLWCALHGEALLQAGMHHLECTFDHDALRDQLAAAGIACMPPFTDLPYLRQCFTAGERWPVRPDRVAALLERGAIDAAQAAHFTRDGAIGSHLENLERNQGFKGFNQHGVDAIIKATDPRRGLHG